MGWDIAREHLRTGRSRLAGRAHRTVAELAQRAIIRPSDFAEFGDRSWIELPSRITGREYISIGSDVHVAARSFIAATDALHGKRYTPRLRIGSGVNLGHALFISCCGEITIGDEVLGSARVFIGDSYHEYQDPTLPVIRQPLADPRPVVIGSGSFLGVGSCVMPGVTLGERAYVAANAVVTSDVPALTVVAGNPARIVKRWDGTEWASAQREPDDATASATHVSRATPGQAE